VRCVLILLILLILAKIQTRMKLLPVFIQVAGELGIGTALFVLIQQTGEIRKSFFTFMSWITAISLFLMALSVNGGKFYASPYFRAAVFAAIAAFQFSSERMKAGKSLLMFAAFLTAFFLFEKTWTAESKTGSQLLAVLNVIAGILLFGWSNGAMILGHWYLVMRGLSFSHFQKATFQLLFAIGIRALVLGVACFYLLRRTDSPPFDMLFFSMRVLWGIVVAGVFSFMAWRCSLTGSNQAGTGLLYIGEVAVLIGEILAGFLGF
jgi:hypothetical protein